MAPRREEVSWFLTAGEGGGVSRGLARQGGLGGLPALRWWGVQGMGSTLLLSTPCCCFQLLQEVAAGFLFGLLYLVYICPNCAHVHNYLQSPVISLSFVARRDICPGTSTAAQGPRP